MTLTNGVSKYLVVREHLLGRVRSLAEGDRLPAEPVLCKEYGVSRITLRHAVDGLIADGWLKREHGRGTFVASPTYRTQYSERFAGAVTGFHNQQSAAGNSVTTKVISSTVRPAWVEHANRLGLNSADLVVEIVRLRFVNGVLHHLVTTLLPLRLFTGIDKVDLTDVSLYDVLRERYRVLLHRNEVVVTIDVAEPRVARLLEVADFEKLLKVSSTVFDAEGHPLAFGWSHFTPQHSEVTFGLEV